MMLLLCELLDRRTLFTFSSRRRFPSRCSAALLLLLAALNYKKNTNLFVVFIGEIAELTFST